MTTTPKDDNNRHTTTHNNKFAAFLVLFGWSLFRVLAVSSRKRGRRQQESIQKLFFWVSNAKVFFFSQKNFDTLNVLLFFVFEFSRFVWENSFCVSSQIHLSSWLVPNKPLVNPPVRCVFLQRDEEDSPSLFSLFSLSNRKGVFLLRVFLVSFLDSNSKTYSSYEIRLETTRVWSRQRATRARTTTKSSSFAFLFPILLRTRARRSVDPFEVGVRVILSLRFQTANGQKIRRR